jgi:glycosyltransferase involved in cell wall biosynthesis
MPPIFTVFTPTWNRAHTLPRVYDSLRAQTLQDFEWVIVDDGSDDGTEAVVRGWMAGGDIAIRYEYQPNRGKPSAVNRGAALARGDLFAILDSDDTLTPDALERLHEIWASIPDDRRPAFSGVTVHCVDPGGSIIGDPFPADPLDAHPWQLTVSGEKWGCHRTAVVRAYPFPIFAGEQYVPEGLIWNRIGHTYLIRFRNVGLRRYAPAPGGVTAHIRTVLIRNPRGAALYYREVLGLPLPARSHWRAAAQYGRWTLHAGRSPAALVADAPRRGLVVLALPLACVAWLLDRWRTPAPTPGLPEALPRSATEPEPLAATAHHDEKGRGCSSEDGSGGGSSPARGSRS